MSPAIEHELTDSTAAILKDPTTDTAQKAALIVEATKECPVAHADAIHYLAKQVLEARIGRARPNR